MTIKSFLLQLILIGSFGCYAQHKEFIKQKDSILGYDNLPYQNGVEYINRYPATSYNTSQFLENKYNPSLLSYKNQIYIDVNLKYDVFDDLLLFKSNTQFFLETNFITKQIDYFILKNKKFKKIETESENKNTTTVGFYEEIDINSKCTLYAKYKKTVKTEITNNEIFYHFYDYKIYYLFYNNALQEIGSKSDVIQLFPNLKKEIKAFYDKEKKLKETNIQLFYQNLFKTII